MPTYKEKDVLRSLTSAIDTDFHLQEYIGTIRYSQITKKKRDRSNEVFEQMHKTTASWVAQYQGIRDVPSTWGDLKILDTALSAN